MLEGAWYELGYDSCLPSQRIERSNTGPNKEVKTKHFLEITGLMGKRQLEMSLPRWAHN